MVDSQNIFIKAVEILEKDTDTKNNYTANTSNTAEINLAAQRALEIVKGSEMALESKPKRQRKAVEDVNSYMSDSQDELLMKMVKLLEEQTGTNDLEIESGLDMEDRVQDGAGLDIGTGLKLEVGLEIETRLEIQAGLGIEARLKIENGLNIESRSKIEDGLNIESRSKIEDRLIIEARSNIVDRLVIEPALDIKAALGVPLYCRPKRNRLITKRYGLE